MSVWKGGLWASQRYPNGGGPWKGGLWRSQQRAAIWTPAQLFANGEQGVFYVPQPVVDGRQVLFTDAAGTTPVTADGDPTGLMLDLSGNGNHATQSVAASRPIYRTDGVLHWLQGTGTQAISTPLQMSTLNNRTSITGFKSISSDVQFFYGDINEQSTRNYWAFLRVGSSAERFATSRVTTDTVSAGVEPFVVQQTYGDAVDGSFYSYNGVSGNLNAGQLTDSEARLTFMSRGTGDDFGLVGGFYGAIVLADSALPKESEALHYIAALAGVTL